MMEGMKMSKKENVIVIVIFLMIFVLSSWLQVVKWHENQGDTALYSDLFRNIITTGEPTSYLASNSLYYIETNIGGMRLDQIKEYDWSIPEETDRNFFTFHFYPIMYLFTPFKQISMDILFPVLTVLSFTSLLPLSYIALRKSGIGIITSVLFVILVISHPAYSIAIQGQLYPDRFFLGVSLLFALLYSNKKINKILFALVALITLLVGERAGSIIGIFSIMYYVLFEVIDWDMVKKGKLNTKMLRLGNKNAQYKVFIGAIALLLSLLVLTLVISNSLYTSYFPRSFTQLWAYLQSPRVIEMIAVCMLFNGCLLILSIFEWRAMLIALVMLSPNIIGNIGGAEKVGWLIHYTTYYFPFIIWAAVMGLKKQKLFKKSYVLNGILIGLIIIVSTANLTTLGFSKSNVGNNLIVKSYNELKKYSNGGAAANLALKDELENAIPKGSKVASVEYSWLPIYKENYISYFPVGYEDADYALVQKIGVDDQGKNIYKGFFSYLGPDEAQKIDDYLFEQMEILGYDLDTPVYESPYSYVVLKRNGK